MPSIVRLLIVLGAALMLTGLASLLLGRVHLPLGRLPGDLSWRGRGWGI